MSAPSDEALVLRDELEKLQGERCGICGHADGRLRLDHDHESGFVRGLLCNTCNLAEGRHGTTCNPHHRCAVCLWRTTPAVSWLGWTVRHSTPMAIIELHRDWVPSETFVGTYEDQFRRCAQVIGERYSVATKPENAA